MYKLLLILAITAISCSKSKREDCRVCNSGALPTGGTMTVTVCGDEQPPRTDEMGQILGWSCKEVE